MARNPLWISGVIPGLLALPRHDGWRRRLVCDAAVSEGTSGRGKPGSHSAQQRRLRRRTLQPVLAGERLVEPTVNDPVVATFSEHAILLSARWIGQVAP
jgi:hypothetical protein